MNKPSREEGIEEEMEEDELDLTETASIVTLDDLGTRTKENEKARSDHVFFEVMDSVKSEPDI